MDLDMVEILLVEDNDEDAELALRALKKHKLENKLHRVVDGAEAVDLLFGRGAHQGRRLTSTRVILLDLKLPKLDGLEVLRMVKADPQLKTLPVVMLTSSKEDRDLEQAYALGVNSCIRKPIEHDEFLHAVEQLGVYWTMLNEQSRPMVE